MKQLSEVLTKEYLSKLENLSMTIKSRLSTGASGIRKSSAKGSSQEFSDYRDYTLGDDLRRVDWNGYARFGRMYLKLFMEEKQAVVNLFIDCSASMDFGGKLFYAKSMAASLACISLKNMDRVNVFACTEKIQAVKQNAQSKNAFVDVVHFLDTVEGNGGSSLYQCVKESRRFSLGHGVSIIFSDLFMENPEDWKEAVKLLQYRKQEVILVWILSEEELHQKGRGSFRLIDSETGENRDMQLTPEILSLYQKALYQYELDIQVFCKKHKVTVIKLSEKTPLLQGLNAVL